MSNQQKQTEWTPNYRQELLARELVNPENGGNISKACEEAGVDRTTYYKWIKEQPEFIRYVNEICDKHTDAYYSRIWQAHVQQALKGDVSAIKLYYEMKRLYKDRKEVTVPVTVKLEDFFKDG